LRIDQVDPRLVLVQAYLKVHRYGMVVIADCSPLDVVDAVWCYAGSGGEDAAAAHRTTGLVIGEQIVPIGHDGSLEVWIR
jgi:hypothetical protein